VAQAEIVADLLRHSAGQMVSTLTRMLGSAHLDLCEDVVQDALLRALENWRYAGVPDNPFAWLVQVARNRALDLMRREKRHAAAALHAVEQWGIDGATGPDFSASEIDDVLGMSFLCAHPNLTPDASVALALKTVAGFSVREISRALLIKEAAVYQRILRAKQQIKEERLAFKLPDLDLLDRVDTVLQIFYLWFNEGYRAREGVDLIRAELCGEAIRLTTLIASHQRMGTPKAHALLALMLFQSARFAARTDAEGDLLLLERQDRSVWDRGMIHQALLHLDACARGDTLTRYHLEAGIAACHAVAPSYEETDWAQIVDLYEQLFALHPTPIIRLNHAVAVSRLRGAAVALPMVEGLRADRTFDHYELLDAVLGQLWLELEQPDRAVVCFKAALAGVWSDPERKYLDARVAELCGHELERR
jgi:RNA polymerase sigma factor (sigma-70 family)